MASEPVTVGIARLHDGRFGIFDSECPTEGRGIVDGGPVAQPVPFVRRVRVSNYRSIGACDVTLGPLTVLVGFNASGKSNFLDVLRFVAEALKSSPAQAVADRGGLDAVLHHTPYGATDSFRIRLDLAVWSPPDDDHIEISYRFEIHRDPQERLPLLVQGEDLTARNRTGASRHHALVVLGRPTDRLTLPLAAATVDDDALAETALRSMRFYDLDSAVLGAAEDRVPQPAQLGPDGQHLGQVLGELRRHDPQGKDRFDTYTCALVPNLVSIDERREGRFSTVQASFSASDGPRRAEPETFLREALSEGTLRAAGVLAALHQRPAFDGSIRLVGIEEPETALNPTRLGAVYEALDDAALRTQVIVTTQSSDLLDSEYAKTEHLRVVANTGGSTRIGRLSAAGRGVVEQGLMSISELHRAGLMEPETDPPGAGPGHTGTPEGGTSS